MVDAVGPDEGLTAAKTGDDALSGIEELTVVRTQ